MEKEAHVLIGSGPLNLFEALHLSKLGHEVTVLESSAKLGGAWGVVQHDGWPSIEIGCHIWDIDPVAYHWISTTLGLDLGDYTPAPQIFEKGRTFPYKAKHLVFEARKALKSPKGFVMAPVNLLKLATASYQYPKGGASEFTSKLLKQLEQAGVKLQTECRVNKLDLSAARVQLDTNQGLIEADQVVMTSFTAVPELVLPDGRSVQVPLGQPRNWVHFHMHYGSVSGKAFSYDRFMDHPNIHRISIITNQIKRAEADWKGEMILVGVHAEMEAAKDDETLKRELFEALQELGYTTKDDQLLRAEKNIYTSEVISGVDREKLLEQTGPKLRWLASTNLAYSISSQVERWSGE